MKIEDLIQGNIEAIYAASSALEAERIVLLLDEEGLKAEKQESSVIGIPTDAGHQFLVTCFAHLSEHAHQVIQKAIDDKIVSAQGTFLQS